LCHLCQKLVIRQGRRKAPAGWWISLSPVRGRSNSPESGPLIEVRAIVLFAEILF
jgi:hypothetical protein